MKISIKNQFLLLVSVLVVVAVVTISIFLFSYINDAITEKMHVVIDNTLKDCAEEIANTAGDIQKLNDSLSIDKRMFELAAFSGDDFVEQIDKVTQIRVEYDKLSYLLLSNMSDGNKCCFLLNSDYPVSKRFPGTENAKLFKPESGDIYRNSEPDGIWNKMDLTRLTILPAEEKKGGIIFAQEIHDNVKFTEKALGINLVQIDIGAFFRKYEAMLGEAKAKLVIIGDGSILVENGELSNKETIISYIENLSQTGLGNNIYDDGKEYIAGTYPIGFGLKLYAMVDNESISVEIKNIAIRIFLVVFIILICLIFVAQILLDRLTRHIRGLSEKMANFNEEIKPENYEESKYNVIEIQQLYDSFKSMNKKIRSLLEEAHKQGQKEKELEMRLLQAQVKPHFLYNALDSIAWCALRREQHDIVDMISALSEGFRYSVKETEKEIPLQDEIDFIIGYLQLQELRYRSAIILRIDIEDKDKKLLVPKFLIQPLVENSIIHGLGEERKNITIRISVKVEDNKVIISISDDGLGADADKLNRYLNGETAIFAEEKIGIGNINKRIKIKFGDDFGLSYKKEDIGTTAQISVPVIFNLD